MDSQTRYDIIPYKVKRKLVLQMGGKTSTASKRKWNNANYEYTQLVTQKGEKELIKQAAQNAGQSVNAYILQAIKSRMEQEGQQTEPTEQEQPHD